MNGGVLRVTGYLLRTTFRRRRGGYLTIVVLVGLLGGLAMGSIAAARRTQSSFPVYLASTNPSDLSLPTAGWQPGMPDSAGADLSIARSLARLPHVTRVENEFNINAQPLGPNGFPFPLPPERSRSASASSTTTGASTGSSPSRTVSPPSRDGWPIRGAPTRSSCPRCGSGVAVARR